MSKEQRKNKSVVVPLFGREEMNLLEFPFGPVTAGNVKTFEVEHEVFDRQLKRFVFRTVLITGSDAFGLPRPIDDQVLVGMKALTFEAGFSDKTVKFSRYQLCKAIGWPISGASYKRLEESLDRIAGTTLKFKNAWWDKGEQEWKSKTFHLIESVEICSRDRLDRARQKKTANQQLCEFVWSNEIWKSFSDGNLKSIDMEMFRKISRGRRREVPLRLFRILDKRLYKKQSTRIELKRLCIGILGLSAKYTPYEMSRSLKRAAKCLVQYGVIAEMKIAPNKKTGKLEAIFRKRSSNVVVLKSSSTTKTETARESQLLTQFESMNESQQARLLQNALKYCRVHQRGIYDGYQRNKESTGSTQRRYLEMVIETFAKNAKLKLAV